MSHLDVRQKHWIVSIWQEKLCNTSIMSEVFKVYLVIFVLYEPFVSFFPCFVCFLSLSRWTSPTLTWSWSLTQGHLPRWLCSLLAALQHKRLAFFLFFQVLKLTIILRNIHYSIKHERNLVQHFASEPYWRSTMDLGCCVQVLEIRLKAFLN